MNRRAVIYVSARHDGSDAWLGLADALRMAAADGGDTIVSVFSEDQRRGRRSAWKSLLDGLDGVDLVIVNSAADLPGRKVADLLTVLNQLREHRVDLRLRAEGIDTGTGSSFDLLDLIAAYRRAKRSQAIKIGVTRARAEGKRIGRPMVPTGIRRRIEAAVLAGAGIRPTARRFGVSAGSVINIRRSVVLREGKVAATSEWATSRRAI